MLCTLMPCAILTSAIIEHTATRARHSQTTAGRDESTARQFDSDDDASTRSPESECKYLHHSKKVILTIYRTSRCTEATTRPVKVTTKVEQEALYSSKPARFGGTQHPIRQRERPCLLDRALSHALVTIRIVGQRHRLRHRVRRRLGHRLGLGRQLGRRLGRRLGC